MARSGGRLGGSPYLTSTWREGRPHTNQFQGVLVEMVDELLLKNGMMGKLAVQRRP